MFLQILELFSAGIVRALKMAMPIFTTFEFAVSKFNSNVGKQGIALSCLKSAIFKFCEHAMATSVLEQVGKLTKSGYPDHIISRATKKLVKWAKSDMEAEIQKRSPKTSLWCPMVTECLTV